MFIFQHQGELKDSNAFSKWNGIYSSEVLDQEFIILYCAGRRTVNNVSHNEQYQRDCVQAHSKLGINNIQLNLQVSKESCLNGSHISFDIKY